MPIRPRIAPLAPPGCPGRAACGISPDFSGLSRWDGQVAYALLTRAPVAGRRKQASVPAAPRLACVRPVASVHPEPGSNSSLCYLVFYFFLLSRRPPRKATPGPQVGQARSVIPAGSLSLDELTQRLPCRPATVGGTPLFSCTTCLLQSFSMCFRLRQARQAGHRRKVSQSYGFYFQTSKLFFEKFCCHFSAPPPSASASGLITDPRWGRFSKASAKLDVSSVVSKNFDKNFTVSK